ncbi:hypothetical protein BpHYR1_010351 [Brachionus plicatilis]|uniref:Uncharacterized protein n=1 Tax=Brachionus plicatilis TaxID=10195 RepID=A0A3M7PB74_BRAPC|nr:hypothetical protein BpHYR1_010351 [Brachionus plicatilis]
MATPKRSKCLHLSEYVLFLDINRQLISILRKTYKKGDFSAPPWIPLYGQNSYQERASSESDKTVPQGTPLLILLKKFLVTSLNYDSKFLAVNLDLTMWSVNVTRFRKKFFQLVLMKQLNFRLLFVKNIRNHQKRFVQLFKNCLVVRQFTGLGLKKLSVYRWLDRKKESGRPAKIVTKLIVAKLRAYFNHKSGRSQRKMTRNRYEFLIDHESNFTLGNTALPRNDIFYSSNVSKTPKSVKNKKTNWIVHKKEVPRTLRFVQVKTTALSEFDTINFDQKVNVELSLKLIKRENLMYKALFKVFTRNNLVLKKFRYDCTFTFDFPEKYVFIISDNV